MILLLDNYDSFTYNLYQYLCELGATVVVRRNDRITIDEAEALAPERIVISPGPCTPHQAGISIDLIRHFAGRVPILGVCLGHQAVGAAFGARIGRAPTLMHGKLSTIQHDGQGVFADLPQGFQATRYHSLMVEQEDLPACFAVSAESADGVIMGLRHRELAIEGVQFHPEAILTEHGHDLLRNFLALPSLAEAMAPVAGGTGRG